MDISTIFENSDPSVTLKYDKFIEGNDSVNLQIGHLSANDTNMEQSIYDRVNTSDSLNFSNFVSSDLNRSITTSVYRDLSVTPLPYSSKVILIIMFTFITVAATIGNSIAIIIFVRGKRSRTELRVFLTNLAAADLIMAIFCIPFTFSYQILGEWVFTAPMCPVVIFLQYVSVTASVFTNMAIGIDRFFAVAFPLRKRLTTSKSKFVILAIWIFAVVINSVQLLIGRTQIDGSGKLQCGESWPDPQKELRQSYSLFVLFLTYFLPLCILTVTYAIVGRILWKRIVPGNSDEARDALQIKSKRKVVKMLVTIVLLFGLCWLPLHSFILIMDFNPTLINYNTQEKIYFAVHWLAMSNSFVNPVVYGFMNDSFRADLRSIIYKMCPCLKRPIIYRPHAKRWKMTGNVHDVCYRKTDDKHVVKGLLTIPDRHHEPWTNGTSNTGVVVLTRQNSPSFTR